jgi:pimeloyl-ACP methyl ester carboxylesterase
MARQFGSTVQFGWHRVKCCIVAHGGFVGSGELWLPPFQTLSKTWRTVTYDHRGSGSTTHRAPAITFEFLVTDLFRVLDALKIEQCVIEAESMGAFVEACISEIGCDAERAWGKLELRRANAKEAVEILECVEHVDFESRLHKILIPTLILHVKKDVICPLASSEKLHQSLTNSKLVVHDDAGHVPTITRPAWVAEQINSSSLFL